MLPVSNTITNTANTIDVSFNAAEVKADLDEYAQDAVIDALTSGTQTRITVGYDFFGDEVVLWHHGCIIIRILSR